MNDQVGQPPGPGPGLKADGTVVRQPFLHGCVAAVCAPATSFSGRDGQLRAQGAQGLYVQELRALSKLVLTIDGAEPVPLGHEVVGGANNEFYNVVPGAGNAGADPTVFVHRHRSVKPDGMVESITVQSFASSPLHCRLELGTECDLASIGIVKGGRRPAPYRPQVAEDGLAWELPGECLVRARGCPRPNVSDPSAGQMAWDVVVPPGQAVSVSLTVELHEAGARAPAVAAPRLLVDGRRPPEILASDHRLRRFVEVSLADLDGLRMALGANPDDVFLAAGAPWYLTLFGRDSIWAARMLLPLGTDLALGTLRALARLQGRAFDDQTGEQPGKMPHEVRRANGDGARSLGPVGDLGPLPPVYYGTVDATPLWVCLLHDAWKWGLPEADVEALLAPMRRCLSWVAEVGCGPSGFISYINSSGRGLTNQGWKDSFDGVQSRDGRLGRSPLALCEVQGYAFEAAVAGADLLDAFGLDEADRWREFAAGLADRFRARFWVEDDQGPYPAIALEGDGTPVDSLASNIGHLLGTGLLNGEESDIVARRLYGPELNSGFGLRTLATSSRGFNPVSYHCGSVWAHDTAIAITGLAGTPGPAASQATASLIEGLLSAAAGFDYRLPELYGGHDRAERRAPLPYPASCHPQAWAAASSIAVLGALSGLRPDLPQARAVLRPLDAPIGLRSVQGFRLGTHDVGVRIDADGRCALTGAPVGLELST